MTEPVLEVKGLSKKFSLDSPSMYFKESLQRKVSGLLKARGAGDNSFWALRDINFSLQQGDVLGIIGRNGSGKSTLLKLLSEILYPSEGEIVFNGNISSILDIGSGFHPDMSGRENIMLYGSLLGIERAALVENMDEIIDFSGIRDFIDVPVKRYSSGMYLRLAFSVALFCKVDILIVDEVLSVGDAQFMMKSYERILEIIKKGLTVVLVSHNMNDILRLCNKCIWLNKGVVEMAGETSKVISAYMAATVDEWHEKDSAQAGRDRQAHKVSWSPDTLPYNDLLTINSLVIRTAGADTGSIYYEDEIVLELDFFKKDAESSLQFVFIVVDRMNTPVLLTSHVFDNSNKAFTKNTIPGQGKLRISCTIPARSLNRGVYGLSIQVMKDATDTVLSMQEAISFEVKTQDTLASKFMHDTPLSMVPAFHWNLEKIS